jgi:hypothetical protein
VYDTDDENNDVDGSKRRGYGDHIFFISHVGVISLFKVLRIYCLRGSSMYGPAVWGAAKFGTLEDLKDSIDKGYDMNVQFKDEGRTTTALHEAVLNNDADKVTLLVRSGADIFATGRRGKYIGATPQDVAWEVWEHNRGHGSRNLSSIHLLLKVAAKQRCDVKRVSHFMGHKSPLVNRVEYDRLMDRYKAAEQYVKLLEGQVVELRGSSVQNGPES